MIKVKPSSIQAHHYAGLNALHFPLVNAWVSRKFNGWNVTYDGGLGSMIQLAEEVPWLNYKHLNGAPYLGFATLGRSSGPQPIFPPDWWLEPIKYTFFRMPVQGELWHISDDDGMLKSIAGQGWAKSRIDERWKDVKFIPCNIKPYVYWTIPSYLRLPFDIKECGFFRDTTLEEKTQKILRAVHDWDSKGFSVNPILELRNFSIGQESELFELKSQMGGEGLMIADKKGYYTIGHSYSLLKLKNQFENEAEVIGHTDGEDKYINKLGALVCRLTWDEKVLSIRGGKQSFVGETITFKVSGMSDEQREWDYVLDKLAKGRRINFSYLSVSSNGVPISANFNHILED